MPTNRQTYGDLFDMPTGLRKFVLSKEFDEADLTLQKTYALTPEQTTAMGDEIMSAVNNDQDLAEMVASIRSLVVPAPVVDAKWKDFLIDLLKLEIWPLRELFGSELTAILNDQQIATSTWPQFRVMLRPLTFSGAASEVAATAGFTLMDPQHRERLRDLIMSRVKAVRVDAQVYEVLIRPADFGGLGLDPQTAEKTIIAINQLIAQVPIMSEDEYANFLSDEAMKKAEPPKSKAPTTPEDKEIAEIRAKMPVPQVPQTVLEESVEKTLAGLSNRPTDPYLAARLQHIISSRFRDVRSTFEMQQLLLRDSKVGGMGFDQAQTTQVTEQIEQAYKTFHDPIMSDEKKKLDQQIELQKMKVDERRKREAEEHAKWYQDRILARKADETQKQELAEKMRAVMSAYAPGPTTPVAPLPMDLKEQKKEVERFGQLVPAIAAGAVPVMPAPTSVTTAPSSAKPPAPPVQGTQPPVVPAAGRVARPEVKVSMETVKLQSAQQAMKPRMDDVTFAGGPKLMGLSQELRQLTLAEFRRLGKDPEAAAQKILQKFDILGQESFEKRTEGIQAWQASPLQELYVRLVSESFAQAKPVVEVAEQKRASGVDTLQPEEVSAIIGLNSKLHY